MYTKKEQYYSLLLPLYFFMQLSRTAYARYSLNKIYLYAETIRLASRKVYKHLARNAAYMPDELQGDILLLLDHYNCWFTQFRDHKKKIKPSLGDVFVFQRLDDQPAFPKDAEERIFKYYEMMKQELASEALVEQ